MNKISTSSFLVKCNCPLCGSVDISPIIYGYPGQELLDSAARGEVSLGGCVVSGNDPQMICNVCGESWSRNNHE